jgi:diguanylate cyclase (GGDEF)-like protein
VIATFDDVTVLHEINEQLNLSNHQLHLSQAKISEQNQKLWQLASTDSLTGCLNRRTFFEEAERALQGARSQRQPMSFLMVDADHFKSINDRFGHVVGDKVLVGLAGLLRSSCRDRDIVGRYGGEEFCVAIMGKTEEDVERLADRIRQSVAGIRTLLPNGERVTISVGMASLKNAPCEMADLVKRADEALYAAKAGGRNRVINWEKMPGMTEAPESGRTVAWQ